MNDLKRNGSGYYDPTAYKALKQLSEEEKTASKVIKTLQAVAHLAGFNIEGRIVLKNNKTGKIWR